MTECIVALTLATTTPVFAGFVFHGKIAISSLVFAFMLFLGLCFLVNDLVPDWLSASDVEIYVFLVLVYGLVVAFMIALGMIIYAIGRCLSCMPFRWLLVLFGSAKT